MKVYLDSIFRLSTTDPDDFVRLDQMTVIDLVEKIADKLNVDDRFKVMVSKEDCLENIIKKVTQLLVNETDQADNYRLSTQESIRGRNYGNISRAGGLAVTLFSNTSPGRAGTVTTDSLIKDGASDCRATNTIFAALLNVAYEKIGSAKSARILYTKYAHGTSPAIFNAAMPEDHNIVLIKGADGKVKVRDAYFEHADDKPLQDLINGCVANSRLTDGENSTADRASVRWGVQITHVSPYPAQQRLHTMQPNSPPRVTVRQNRGAV